MHDTTYLAVNFAIAVRNGRGVEALIARNTAEAEFVPRLARADHLLGEVDSFAAARAHVGTAKLRAGLRAVGKRGISYFSARDSSLCVLFTDDLGALASNRTTTDHVNIGLTSRCATPTAKFWEIATNFGTDL